MSDRPDGSDTGGDARFAEGAETALRLCADDAEGLAVISALVQDAVLSITDIRLDRKRRRLVMLINRFRWEDREAAERRGRGYERVRALLVIDQVLRVASQGIDRHEADMVLSVLALDWQPGAEGAGRLTLTLAGDGAVAVEVECLDVLLRDVTRPYLAPSGHLPQHPE